MQSYNSMHTHAVQDKLQKALLYTEFCLAFKCAVYCKFTHARKWFCDSVSTYSSIMKAKHKCAQILPTQTYSLHKHCRINNK